MSIDPRISFWLGLITTIALALSNGSVWSDLIPVAWVPAIKGWNALIGLLGTAVLTFLHGYSSDKGGPLAK